MNSQSSLRSGFAIAQRHALTREAKAERLAPSSPNPSASLKRDGPDGTVIWTPGNILKSDDRHSPT
jgi:hypothetical protein